MCGFAAAGLALTAISTVAQISQGQQQAKQQKKYYEQNAQNEQAAYALRSEDRARKFASMQASANARYGAAGVAADGTPGDVLESNAAAYARDQFMDQFNTQNRVAGYGMYAANSNYNWGAPLFQAGGSALDYAARTANRG